MNEMYNSIMPVMSGV